MWRPALRELDAIDPGRRAVAVDLPGHGESPDHVAYDLATTVARINAAVLEAGLDSPVLVGHSASAGVVAMYAAQHPTRGMVEVDGTVDVAPFARLIQSLRPELDGPGFDAAWARVSGPAFRLDEVSDDVRRFVAATSRPRRDVVVPSWADLLTRSADDLEHLIVGAALRIREAGIPVVSVMGGQPSAAELAWYRANLPDAEVLVWPGSGHFPHLAYPNRFARLLTSTGPWVRAAAGASARL
jgi:pimeloyl-ACP methyl ester carboxylesterase